jgi:hypothetical protein
VLRSYIHDLIYKLVSKVISSALCFIYVLSYVSDIVEGAQMWVIENICGVSKRFGECYQKTNKTEDTSKLTLLAFKIITFYI